MTDATKQRLLIKCAESEGWGEVIANEHMVYGEKDGYSRCEEYHKNHNAIQRLVDRMDVNETELYCGHLMLLDCHTLVKATCEQKFVAYCLAMDWLNEEEAK